MGGGTRGLRWWRSKLLWVIGLAALATVVMWFVGLFALNRSADYGRINIPGSAVVHLPAGEVDLSLEAQVTSFGSGTNISLPIPNLAVSVLPVGGGLVPGREEALGGTISNNSDAHRQFAKLDVQSAGNYRVTVSGNVGGFIEPQLDLGAPGLATKILLAGGSVVFLLALIYTLSGLLLPQATPVADSATNASTTDRRRFSRRHLSWPALGIEAVGAAALLVLLFAGGALSIPPQGRVDASGQVVSGSASTGGGENLLSSPLPSPTAADTVGADSASSMFHHANLAKALQALASRIGAKGDIALMAIYPGELDLVQDDSNGNLHRVRVALDGTVTLGPPVPTATGPPVVYVNQLDPSLITKVEDQLTNAQGSGNLKITELVLKDLSNSTAGWMVKTATSDGRPGPTFQAQLDGSGLQALK